MLLISAFALLGLMVVPVTASADDVYGVKHDAQGRLMKLRGTYIGFDIKGQKLKNFSVTATITCTEPTIVTLPLRTKKVSTKINKKTKKFSVNYKVKFEGVKGKVKISGKVKGKNYSGVATVRFNHPEFGKCTSGAMDWKAKKGKKINMPTGVPAGKATAFANEGGLR